ncbi:hypothetical protein [Flavobacterium filum]|jgi:hypothetical protein|uniref:hypothetical protein n=1 Tax=Flavobacterium filum TaxID=370974 RepID=UPI0023F28887|nr:hypothetical protein [Flavobacterium filum]
MGQIYIKFKVNKLTTHSGDRPKAWLTRTLQKFLTALTTIIPKANPDFDDKIDDVDEWLVEINEKTGEPEREIGINNVEQTIAIMPFNQNYGYWTDNTFNLDDFVEKFNATQINSKEFNNRWDRYENGKAD